MTHALTLQGTNYSTELEVYADGWQLKLVDAYNAPALHVRTPWSDNVEVISKSGQPLPAPCVAQSVLTPLYSRNRR